MANPVSVLDGEVNRNWHLVDNRGQRHLLTLFHDCVTGARAAMLDYEQVPGSAGTTNLFNLVAGRDMIPFRIESTGESGHLSVLRRGLAGFSYECELNGRVVLDTTSVVQNTDYDYEVSIPASVDIGSRVSGVTWYEVHSRRKADGKGTLITNHSTRVTAIHLSGVLVGTRAQVLPWETMIYGPQMIKQEPVHRRFRDFFAMHVQVESLMKGHHLRSSLPRFPEKKSKLWTNHGDMSFVEQRRQALESYMKTLLQLPHVSTLDSTRAFLGMVGNLREFSVIWDGKELGATLKRASGVAERNLVGGSSSAGDGVGPPVIASIQGSGKSPPGVSPGDRLFRVNGEPMEFMSLEAAWSAFKSASRPVLLHFLGPIIRMDSTLAQLPEAFLRRRVPDGRKGQPSLVGDDGGPPLASGLLRPDFNAAGGGHAGGAESQWGLRGISQMRWPTWGRQQDGTSAFTTGGGYTSGAAAGVGRHCSPGGPSFGGSGMPPGRAVGPFGDGAGASHSSPSSNSRLFGEAENDDVRADAGERHGRPWRSSEGTGVAGLQSSMRPLGDNKAGRGSRTSSDWMPDMSIGDGGSSSDTGTLAATTLWGASSQPSGTGLHVSNPKERRLAVPLGWPDPRGSGTSTTLRDRQSGPLDALFGERQDFDSGSSATSRNRPNAPSGALFGESNAERSNTADEKPFGERHGSTTNTAGAFGSRHNKKSPEAFLSSPFGEFGHGVAAGGRPVIGSAFGEAVPVDEEEVEENPFA